MSNSLRFAQLVQSAYKSDDLNSALTAYNEWQQSHCYHPIKQQIYDAHSQVFRNVFLPCGSCYHCLESKINEWVTRMYAHAEDFKNVYFVTLTYRSIYSVNDVERLILNKLVQAVWHRDSLNSVKRSCYRPCLLVKKHYQDFLKRLRKYTGLNDITYVLCGEYGSKYGSPHFHAILFTNGTLTAADIRRAWSVALWRSDSGSWSFKTNQRNNGQSYYFPIGRIDFNDLVSNGTFNTNAKIKIDNNFYSAGRCFAYVCKYVNKKDKPNTMRLNMAFNGLFQDKEFVRLYDNEIPLSIAVDWLKDHGYYYNVDIDHSLNNETNLFYNNNETLKRLSYVKKVEFLSPSVYSEGLQRCKKMSLFGHDVEIEVFAPDYLQFRDSYSPFVEFSRGTPIGSLYAVRHLQEFKEGVFNKPILQDTSFVVPSYFRAKARNSIFGLRKMRKGFKGTSYYLGALFDFKRLFETCNSTGARLPFVVPSWLTSKDYEELLRDDFYTLRDIGSGEKILIINERVKHFKYDRHSRSYVCSRQMPVADWIRYWCDRFTMEFDMYKKLSAESKESNKQSDFALCLMTDLGSDPTNLREHFESVQDTYLHRKQFDYDQLHPKTD